MMIPFGKKKVWGKDDESVLGVASERVVRYLRGALLADKQKLGCGY